jgi:two-component system cell cycle sensor histidine kinase/response regulator CckA
MLDILLVEDDELVRDCLEVALLEAGLDAKGSVSGEAALDLLKDGKAPRVVVTDINLGPGMDGLAFMRAARQRWPGLPVVFISGRYDSLRGMSASERFLHKPFTTPALLRAIEDVCAAATETRT